MVHAQTEIHVTTRGRGLYEITQDVIRIVADSEIDTGLCVVFCRHTSASLVIQENADPTAGEDLLNWLERLAPDGDPAYRHTAEGPDDMPAHLRSAVTKTSESLPVAGGRPVLGTWQGIFLIEHRSQSQRRSLVVHVSGERA